MWLNASHQLQKTGTFVDSPASRIRNRRPQHRVTCSPPPGAFLREPAAPKSHSGGSKSELGVRAGLALGNAPPPARQEPIYPGRGAGRGGGHVAMFTSEPARAVPASALSPLVGRIIWSSRPCVRACVRARAAAQPGAWGAGRGPLGAGRGSSGLRGCGHPPPHPTAERLPWAGRLSPRPLSSLGARLLCAPVQPAPGCLQSVFALPVASGSPHRHLGGRLRASALGGAGCPEKGRCLCNNPLPPPPRPRTEQGQASSYQVYPCPIASDPLLSQASNCPL